MLDGRSLGSRLKRKLETYLARSGKIRDNRPNRSVCGLVTRLEDFERQASSKESRERHVELWESTPGDRTSDDVPKDIGEVIDNMHI